MNRNFDLGRLSPCAVCRVPCAVCRVQPWPATGGPDASVDSGAANVMIRRASLVGFGMLGDLAPVSARLAASGQTMFRSRHTQNLRGLPRLRELCLNVKKQ